MDESFAAELVKEFRETEREYNLVVQTGNADIAMEVEYLDESDSEFINIEGNGSESNSDEDHNEDVRIEDFISKTCECNFG